MNTEQRRPVRGHVVSWHAEEGWGVLASAELPGEVWVHFSGIRPSEPGAYRTLVPRDAVLFTWEEADQDGYSLRAIEVRRASDVTDATVWERHEPGDDMGYRSELRIRWDDDR